MSERKIVLSLGAGVQSSTLALMAKHGEIEMPDLAVFADTMREPASVYRWLDWLESQLPFPVVRVSAFDLYEKATELRESKNGVMYAKYAVPAFTIDGRGKIGIMNRQCTQEAKIAPIRRAIKEHFGKGCKVIQYIGISLDEVTRIKDSRVKWLINTYPLIDKRMRRHDCLLWLERQGYSMPPRSACTFCPFHSDREWRRLKEEEPEAFAEAVQFEKEYQAAYAQVGVFGATPYLHRSCVPLGEVDFNRHKDQIDMFGNECEGFCGV